AGAENDGSFTPEQAEQLDKALTAAGVEHSIETYPAAHGFAVPDNAPYDAAAADRHWTAMRDLFGAKLAAPADDAGRNGPRRCRAPGLRSGSGARCWPGPAPVPPPHKVGITRPLHVDTSRGVVDLAEVVGRQLDIGRRKVLLEPIKTAGAGNRNNPWL